MEGWFNIWKSMQYFILIKLKDWLVFQNLQHKLVWYWRKDRQTFKTMKENWESRNTINHCISGLSLMFQDNWMGKE
jgi:hypothetical protein